MHPALWISKTGLDAQQTDINIISNNLANVNTIGYKKGRAVFEDLLYQSVQQPGSLATEETQQPTGIMMGTGVRPVATEKNFSQGSIIQTDNPLDVAIEGQGFFQILLPDGTLAYTRAGQFKVNSAGELVTSSGYKLQPSITVPTNTKSVTIGKDGIVGAIVEGEAEATELGKLELAQFINSAGLKPIGENLYKETPASGTPQLSNPGSNGIGSISQGFLESSNVNVVEELVNMIQTQRAYEINSKAISTVDKMLEYTNQTL